MWLFLRQPHYFSLVVSNVLTTNKVLRWYKRPFFNCKNLEDIYKIQYPDRLLVCDRGSLDGLAYWPNSESDFFKQINSTFEQELERYDAVIFFESAAASGQDISSNNPTRSESLEQAAKLDKKLQRIWSKHPHFYFVGSSESFVRKIMFGIMTLENVINRYPTHALQSQK